ncbi:hypothetical protein CEXT_185941 [Caerostris extrusa]|uniref:Uncharacterized protein n=1 Tax=Caerostris extrusa TaxID=172846 RepID=A0AAV4MGL5_CAEEX|nr:hypothetical protein CEXT_185941 [Caerostris extrusa]
MIAEVWLMYENPETHTLKTTISHKKKTTQSHCLQRSKQPTPNANAGETKSITVITAEEQKKLSQNFDALEPRGKQAGNHRAQPYLVAQNAFISQCTAAGYFVTRLQRWQLPPF